MYDLKVAVRGLVQRPGHSLAVVLTLMLGIGASATIFSLFDAALLRSLPFADADRLVMLWGVYGPERDIRGASIPEIQDWRALNHTLDNVAVYDEISLNLRAGGEVRRVDAEMVSASYFDILGVAAELGRTFRPDEDATPDERPVAVVSQRLWRQRFGASHDILGTTILLNDRPFTIVGVMPRGFAGLSFDTDVWVPAAMVSLTASPAAAANRGNRWLAALGRLRPDRTMRQAQDDLERVASILTREYPDTNTNRSVNVVRVRESMLGATRGLILALFAAVLLFLLITCANVAGLQLARTVARRRELSLRLALGASQWRLVRQILVESLLLSTLAGIGAALVAAWGLTGLMTLAPAGALPGYVQPALDLRSLSFTSTAAIASAVLVTLLPTLAWTRSDLIAAIKQGGPAVSAGLGSLRRLSAHQVLVATEIAMSMTLLIAAGLLVHSTARQLSVRVGFETAAVTAARLTLPADRYARDDRSRFVEQLLARLQQLPDVSRAAIATDMPFTGNSNAAILSLGGSDRTSIRFYRHGITPGFFRALGIPLLRGRDFTTFDTATSSPVAIVSESGARRLWGSLDKALGRQIQVGSATIEIVGVVADLRYRDLTTDLGLPASEPDVFQPFPQRADRDLEIAVRTTSGQPLSIASLQQTVSAIDPGLPVYAVRRLADAVAQQTATIRFGSWLLGIFSAGALLLAAIGLYGLVSYVVTLSTGEVAIRLALGASAARIVRLVVRNGLVLVGVGVLLGAFGAFAAGRALEAQLFQTSAFDPRTYAAVTALLTLIATAAIVAPARRIARTEPHVALRAEVR